MPAATDLAFEFICRAGNSIDASTIVEDYARTVAALGFSSFIMTGLPNPGEDEDVVDLIHLEHWPKGWHDTYRDGNFFHRDPVSVAATACAAPFTWAQARLWYTHSPASAEVAELAREHGLEDGLVVPLFGTGTRHGIVSLGGEAGIDLTSADIGIIFLTSVWCHLRLNEIEFISPGTSAKSLAPRKSFPTRESLTPREREILKWMAHGKSAWEAGQILDVTEATVNTHLRNIRQKLGSTNTTHAVAQALVSGLIAL